MLSVLNSVIVQPIVNNIASSEAAMLLLIVCISMDVLYVVTLWAADACGRLDQFRKAWNSVKIIPIVAMLSVMVVCLVTDPLAVISLFMSLLFVGTLLYGVLICIVNSVIGLGNVLTK